MNVWTVCMVHSFLVYTVIFRNSTTRICDKHTIGPKSFFFIWHCTVLSLGQMVQLIIITNNINSLLIGSRCIPNGAHTPLLSQFGPCFISKTLSTTVSIPTHRDKLDGNVNTTIVLLNVNKCMIKVCVTV